MVKCDETANSLKPADKLSFYPLRGLASICAVSINGSAAPGELEGAGVHPSGPGAKEGYTLDKSLADYKGTQRDKQSQTLTTMVNLECPISVMCKS